MVSRLPRLSRSDPVMGCLLQPRDPAVRRWALAELLDAHPGSRELKTATSEVLQDPAVRALFRGRDPEGGFGSPDQYRKWNGVHWRLVSLVELGVPPGHGAAVAASRTVLDWMTSGPGSPSLEGKGRYWVVLSSMDGNALATACRLGLGSDPQAAVIARRLVKWQRPDGGWNCDPRPGATHSSFHESLATMWGLWEHHCATGDRQASRAAHRSAERIG